MKKLEKIIKLRGLGIPVIAEQVKRTDKKAMYLRSDGYYEVFKVTINKEKEIFGKKYPVQEHYPSNEDFGKIAICTSNFKQADRFYKIL